MCAGAAGSSAAPALSCSDGFRLPAVLGKKLQLVLLGHYSDGTTQFLTESATLSSSATGIATASTTAGSKGLATSVGFGSTTITANGAITFEGRQGQLLGRIAAPLRDQYVFVRVTRNLRDASETIVQLASDPRSNPGRAGPVRDAALVFRRLSIRTCFRKPAR
jgi:hypothetical protein